MSSIKKCSDCGRVVTDQTKSGGTRYVIKDGKYFCDALCVDNYLSKQPYKIKAIPAVRIQTEFMHKSLPICLVVEDSTYHSARPRTKQANFEVKLRNQKIRNERFKAKKLSTGRA